MSKILKLVPRLECPRTKDVFFRLSLQASQGMLAGAIIIPIYNDRRYFVCTAGIADDPTYAAGVMEVAKLVLTENALNKSFDFPTEKK